MTAIELGGGRMFFAPTGTPPPVIWQDVGGTDLSSLSFEADERLALTIEPPLTMPAPVTMTFGLSPEATAGLRAMYHRYLRRELRRQRRRMRTITRRKYRARRRSS